MLLVFNLQISRFVKASY